jgi:hypothetical protein
LGYGAGPIEIFCKATSTPVPFSFEEKGGDGRKKIFGLLCRNRIEREKGQIFGAIIISTITPSP